MSQTIIRVGKEVDSVKGRFHVAVVKFECPFCSMILLTELFRDTQWRCIR